MDMTLVQRKNEIEWRLPLSGRMRVPGIIYATKDLIRNMDVKVLDQIANVASLPGIEKAAYAMPDAHWGYGFPIGGVAAFDPDHGGVISAGGVGFDISCGVRTLLTGISEKEILPFKNKLADALFTTIPAGIGSTGSLHLNTKEMDAMLLHGAKWAVQNGYGTSRDIERSENYGKMPGALPENISGKAHKRQQNEMGTLGSGNHYLEVQQIKEIYDSKTAEKWGLRKDEIVISIHCGSRGLGHQVATEFSKTMIMAANSHGIQLPHRELACAPIQSPEGQAYLGAMRAAVNCALANRQIITHLVRKIFGKLLGLSLMSDLPLLYDVSHNTCNIEEHNIDGKIKRLFVHRKGATRAIGPGHPDLPSDLKPTGQPVIIGGTMGTSSYILAGTGNNQSFSFNSACHGAGRQLSRTQAKKQWQGKEVIKNLAMKNILIRSHSNHVAAEEAPGAYKDVNAVVEATETAHLARKVARMKPLICIKG